MKAIFLSILLSLMMLCPAHGQSPDIIQGLDTLPVITQEIAALFPPASAAVEITTNGFNLPRDEASNTYFISQSALSARFEGEVTINKEEGFQYYLLPDALCGKEEALTYSRGYAIYGTDGQTTHKSTVLFTAHPTLSITTQHGALPGEEDEHCTVLYFEAKDGNLTAQSLRAEINLRGNTSKIFPKQSYRLQFIDAFGDNRHVSLADLRTDDDWILNPMYTDNTKLRETLAYALWQQINSSGSAANSSRIAYVEVFFDGHYHGLYGLQERVDMKQVDGSKKNDVLYKVRTNERPTAEQLLSATDRTALMAFEVENGDDFRGDTQALYRPAAAYMAALSGETLDPSISLDLNNVIDYGLFVMITQAHDNHFKNQFLNAVSANGHTTLYKLPWDLNYTLGDVYRKDNKDTNYTDSYTGKLMMDALFEQLLTTQDPTFLLAVKMRWQHLRSTVLTKENLLELTKSLDDSIFAARARDHIRWPEGGKREGNNGDYEEILDYFSQTLPKIDLWCEALVPQKEQ